ncbi:MAG: hypothetical protein ACEQSK_13255 [Sphingomonadaceae bacterium]
MSWPSRNEGTTSASRLASSYKLAAPVAAGSTSAAFRCVAWSSRMIAALTCSIPLLSSLLALAIWLIPLVTA